MLCISFSPFGIVDAISALHNSKQSCSDGVALSAVSKQYFVYVGWRHNTAAFPSSPSSQTSSRVQHLRRLSSSASAGSNAARSPLSRMSADVENHSGYSLSVESMFHDK